MKPYHHRTFLPVIDSWSPDIYSQTVLVRESVIPVECKSLLVAVPACPFLLWGCRTVCPAAPDAFPRVSFHRRHESFSLGVRDAFVHENAVVHIAGYLAVLSLNDSAFIAGCDFILSGLESFFRDCATARNEGGCYEYDD